MYCFSFRKKNIPQKFIRQGDSKKCTSCIMYNIKSLGFLIPFYKNILQQKKKYHTKHSINFLHTQYCTENI